MMSEQNNLNKYINLWLSNREVKIQSKQRYKRLIDKHLVNLIGEIDISKITKDDIINFIKKKNESGVSLSTQKVLFGIIRGSLEVAYSMGMGRYQF